MFSMSCGQEQLTITLLWKVLAPWPWKQRRTAHQQPREGRCPKYKQSRTGSKPITNWYKGAGDLSKGQCCWSLTPLQAPHCWALSQPCRPCKPLQGRRVPRRGLVTKNSLCERVAYRLVSILRLRVKVFSYVAWQSPHVQMGHIQFILNSSFVDLGPQAFPVSL